MRSVREFGARGDGVSDDTPAFQQALDSAALVEVPEGTYALSSYVRVRPGHRLIGEGIGATILKRIPSATSSIILGVGGSLEHVTVDGNWPLVNADNELGLSPGAHLDHVRWQNGSHGCGELQSGARITNCEFWGAGQPDAGAWYGLWFGQGGLSDIVIKDSIFTGMRINAIFGGSDGLRITGCQFINNHCQIQPTGGGQIDIVGDGRNTWITENYFGPCTGAASALEIDSVDRIMIAKNIIERQPGSGIVLQTSNVHNVMVSDNYVFDCDGAALEMARIDNLIWVNNRFHNNRGGIHIDAAGLQDRNNAVT